METWDIKQNEIIEEIKQTLTKYNIPIDVKYDILHKILDIRQLDIKNFIFK